MLHRGGPSHGGLADLEDNRFTPLTRPPILLVVALLLVWCTSSLARVMVVPSEAMLSGAMLSGAMPSEAMPS